MAASFVHGSTSSLRTEFSQSFVLSLSKGEPETPGRRQSLKRVLTAP